MTDANTAYIVSRDGMWKIDLTSRKVEQIGQVMMTDGSYISSSRLNTIYTDRDGNVWVGSYDHGLLKGSPASTEPASPSFPIWSIGLIVLIAVCLIALLWFWFSRRKLSTFNSQPSALSPQPSALNPQPSTIPIDHELITRATSLVEENLSTPNYTVERLAQDLCMDRTGLYKKMTAMLGKTPTVFMRSIRVNHAVQLIREGKLTMTEVAEQSGFSSASYMAKCFQEDLGKNPSDLRENQP